MGCAAYKAAAICNVSAFVVRCLANVVLHMPPSSCTIIQFCLLLQTTATAPATTEVMATTGAVMVSRCCSLKRPFHGGACSTDAAKTHQQMLGLEKQCSSLTCGSTLHSHVAHCQLVSWRLCSAYAAHELPLLHTCWWSVAAAWS